MSRKIIILPSFASSHLLKCSIPNWLDVLEPDIIIINEGIFPGGIENKKEIDANFRKKWCHADYPSAGFDYKPANKNDEFLDILEPYLIQWNENGMKLLRPDFKCIWKPHAYKSLDANECFLEAISTFYDFEPEVGDILMPLEPDVLFHENDKEKIQEELKRLTPGDGIQVVWKDFLETQFYVEAINEVSPKWRRFAYCFDNMENYKNAMDAFMTQNYKSLRKVDDFIGFHYSWFVFDKWKKLRYELIWRKDPQYWEDFDEGLQEIRKESEEFSMNQHYLNLNELWNANVEFKIKDKILIRPSRTDEARWAKFIDISHPKHIQSHPNFIK